MSGIMLSKSDVRVAKVFLENIVDAVATAKSYSKASDEVHHQLDHIAEQVIKIDMILERADES